MFVGFVGEEKHSVIDCMFGAVDGTLMQLKWLKTFYSSLKRESHLGHPLFLY